MKSEWPMAMLGEAISHRKAFIEIEDGIEYKRCRVQLRAQGILLRDRVAGSEIRTKRQQVCQAGDFLVAEIDAKVGGYGIVPPELDGAIVSSHYFLYEINEKKLLRGWLGLYIRTPMFHDQVGAQGSTNYAAIRPDHVLNYKIPLPGLPDQERIVKWADALLGRAAAARRIATEIEEMTVALAEKALRQEYEPA